MEGSLQEVFPMHPSADTRVGRIRVGVRVPLAVILATLGCTGTVADNSPGAGSGGDKQPGGGTVTPPTPPGKQPIAPADVSAGVAPLRRLTRAQYLNSVH